MLYKVMNNKTGHVSWFIDFISQYYLSAKPQVPQQLANFINCVTSPKRKLIWNRLVQKENLNVKCPAFNSWSY